MGPTRSAQPITSATIVTHYIKEDLEMISDYNDITIRVYAGGREYCQTYGDSYHDSGQDKAQGFMDALRVIFGPGVPILQLRQADRA